VTAQLIARELGNAWQSGQWWRARCPVHQSSGATLALKDDDQGLVVHCHAGCRRAAIMTELRRLGLLGDIEEPPDPEKLALRRAADVAHRRSRIALGLDIWNNSHLATATTQVPCYLATRGYRGTIPDTIRVHGMAWHPSGETRPMMVALVEHVEHGPVGVSCTYLAVDGSGKASLDPPRLFRGPVSGGAVRLAAVRPREWLVVAEGIETTLSVMQATGLPGWAALSEGGISRLILPPEARRVLIAADNDANGAGLRGARRAAQRWLAAGRRVQISIPSASGSDWNDALSGMGGRHAA
jgi:putative DNA primase/helicase